MMESVAFGSPSTPVGRMAFRAKPYGQTEWTCACYTSVYGELTDPEADLKSMQWCRKY